MLNYIQHTRSIVQLIAGLSIAAALSACGGAATTPTNTIPTDPITIQSSSSIFSSSKSSSKSTLKSSSSTAKSSSSKANSSSTQSTQGNTPNPPEYLYVVSALSDRILIEWRLTESATNIKSFRIFRNKIQVDTIQAPNDSFVDFSVAPNKLYSYAISAGDTSGNWSALKEIDVTTPEAPAISSSSSSSQTSAGSSSIKSSQASSNNSAQNSSSSASSLNSSTTSSKSSNSSSKSAIASSSAPAVSGNITLKWTPPTAREDHTSLNMSEIGGYEIRYSLQSAPIPTYNYILIQSNAITSYTIKNLSGSYIFEIAAYDTNHLYSTFAKIVPQ